MKKNVLLIENKKIEKIEILKRNQIDNFLGINIHQGIAIYCDKLSNRSIKSIEKEKNNSNFRFSQRHPKCGFHN